MAGLFKLFFDSLSSSPTLYGYRMNSLHSIVPKPSDFVVYFE